MIAFILVADLLGIAITTGQQGQGCIGHVCKNNGILEESSCECLCPAEYSGINCEYEIERSFWPPGPYAIPTPIDGCPESYPKGWTEGYVNITTLEPWGIWITQNDSKYPLNNNLRKPETTKFNIAEDRLHIPYTLGPYGRYTFQLNFCYKSKSHKLNSMYAWPSGDYSIYGAKNGCPTGFDVDNTTVILSEVMSLTYDGDLPNMDITYENDQVKITLSICQRLEVEIQNDTPFLADTPFMLLKGKGNCALFRGFNIKSELLQTSLLDQTNNSQIYEGIVLQMCYYTPMTYVEEPIDVAYFSMGCKSITSVRVYFQEGYYKVFSVYSKLFIYRNYIQVGMHTVEYIHVLVSEFQRTSSVPWILLDLKQRSAIQGVVFFLMDRLSSEDYSVLSQNPPDMYLSNEKWSFLNNGAILGRKALVFAVSAFSMKQYHFLKYQAVRYLSIVATKYKTDAIVLKFYLMIQQLFIYQGCGEIDADFSFRELGMFEGIIKDNQLSATSWQKEHPPSFARQYLNGWCADITDVNPYLQVDLIAPSTINGITVDSGFRDEKQEDVVGWKSFRLMYGTFQKSLKYYIAVFELDLSLPSTEPQTKIFRKPFLARYIRIYPQTFQGYNNSVCLRLELLGCAKKVILSKQCKNNSIIYPSNETNALVSPDDTSMKYGNITQWTECFDMCMKSVRNCSTLLYRDTDCTIYSQSNTSKYVEYEVENKVDIMTTITCITEIDVYTPVEIMIFHYVSNEENTIQHNKPGVLTSIGYPYHYFPDQLYIWNITLADGEYIRLLFSNISLHVYKETSFEVIDECQTNINITHRSSDIIHTLLNIDNRWNGYTPTIATPFTTLSVYMYTCFKTAEKTHTGIGFRAIVEKHVIPTCWSLPWNDMIAVGYCRNEKMTFGSNSYFGLKQTDHIYFWSIELKDVRVIILKILNFDVNCQQGAIFKVVDPGPIENQIKLFCNTKRPVGSITSSYDILTIQYTPPSDEYQYFDGFYAEYSTQPLINPDLFEMDVPMKVVQMTSSPPEVTTNTLSYKNKKEMSTGCSNRFNKCYVIYPTFERSWQDASNFCWSRGMNLSSIHTQLEFQFVRQALVNFTKENIVDNSYNDLLDYSFMNSPVMDPLLYSYIGLRRYTDSTGKQDSLWEDGTPLTFTAWGKHKAVEVHKHLCTRIGFHLLNEANTWEPTDCDVRPGTAGYFICQQTYNTSNNENSERQGLRTNTSTFEPASDLVDKNYKCEDGTLISTLSVCDGFPDCFDWSDEGNCTEDGKGDEEMFLCNDGRHIHISYLCNYVHDCYDGSDEFCDFPSCQSTEFQCANKQCVSNFKTCDASLDCLDGSDEINCETCNTTVAIKCGDLSCVPISQVCDNHADCSDSADEQACDQYESTNPKSCSAVWEAGYRENGTYNLVDGTVECQFYNQPGHNDTIVKVWTILHEMYIDYNVSYNNGSSHKIKFDGTLINSLKTDQFCHQKIVHVCTPDLLALAESDGIYEDVLYTTCICNMRVINYQSDKMQDFRLCSELNEPTEEIEVSHLLDTTDRKSHYILHPTVCSSEFKVLTKTIKCEGSHHLIPYSRRCLYLTDSSGHVDGCRSLTHLQDCETFQCPSMYVKCPNSYCIEVKHICDGTKNCPAGQDEENCWCRAYRKETVILFYAIDIDVGIQKAISKLAKQLYVSSQNVRVLKIKDTTISKSSLKRRLYISDETINANDERLNRYHSEDYTVLSHDLATHIRDSFTRDSVGKSIIIIQHGLSLVDFFQFDEETASDTLYFVVEIDEKISKKAEIRKKSQITEIKIRKFGEHIAIETILLKVLCKESDNTTCIDMYKCASSHVCIHLDQVCDAERDCPYGDDEYFCQFTCPDKCKCKGLVVDCVNVQFQTSDFKNISIATRSFDLSYNTDVKTISFKTNMTYMYRLNISHGGLQIVNRDAFLKLTNLKILDISFNKFKTITTDTFKDLKLLETLHIFGNKLLANIQAGAFNGLTEIKKLAITGTQLKTVVIGTFIGLKLSILNLTYNQISTIEDMAFNDLEVNTIDIRGNEITNFNKDMFTGVRSLHSIYSKAYKFCCIRPSSVNQMDCYPYKDGFSSCEDLMTNNVLQALLWVTGICAILGNGMSFGYRCLNDKKQMKLGFGIFVTNLAMADFLMGVYLLIIAIADTLYRDRYIWNEDYWRNSIWCTIAGVLSTVASEAGVLFVCLITLDRIIVIKFPFGQIRFKTRSAIVCSILSWLLVVFIALFPLMHTEYFQNQFYTKSGVCLALPLTGDRPPGWQYSIAVFVGFNCVTFILISIGQFLIFFEIKRSKRRVNSQTSSRGNDLTIAKNLLLVVATDFLCWFPIGCIGMLALNGYTISGEVYAWTAVFVLPINSAINPFLYTLAGILFKSKFVPRIDEQTETRQSKFLERGKGIMDILDSRIVFLPPATTNAVNTMSLEKYVTNNRVTPRDVLIIAVQMTCAIRYVHKCNLVLQTLDMTTITAVTRNDGQGLDNVQLQLMPSVCANKNEKMEEIYNVGVFIRKLLNK